MTFLAFFASPPMGDRSESSADHHPSHDANRPPMLARGTVAIVVLAGDVEDLAVHARHAARVRPGLLHDDPLDVGEAFPALEVVRPEVATQQGRRAAEALGQVADGLELAERLPTGPERTDDME